MIRFYLVPVERLPLPNGKTSSGPKYFIWPIKPPYFIEHPGIITDWAMMDYGFAPYALLLAKDISQADHDALILNSDVYAFPETLTQTITPQDNLATFFEGIGIPTDWLTPSNTYLEFMRQLAAMFYFNQVYRGISHGHDLITDAGGLNTRYLTWNQQTRDWFNAALASLGYPAVVGNPTLRQLMKLAGDYWGAKPFVLGGVEF